MLPDDVCFRSARELVEGYATAAFRPSDVIEAILSRIARLNPLIRAFVHVDADGARAAARQSDLRWQTNRQVSALDGVPYGVKDVFDVTGWPTLRGSFAVPDDHIARADSPIVRAMRHAGAIAVGKTATPEFGWSATTESARHGVTRNPYDVTLSTGGSSGGAAAAVAAGLGPIHIGADAGGSVCCPASWCGIVGYRPSVGELDDAIPYAWDEVETAGFLARTVDDAIAARAATLNPEAPRRPSFVPGDPPTIGFTPDLGFASVDPRISAVVAAGAERLATALGSRTRRLDARIPDPRRSLRALYRRRKLLEMERLVPDERAAMEPRWRRLWDERDAAKDSVDVSLIADAMRGMLDSVDVIVTTACEIMPFAVGLDPEADHGDFERVVQCFCVAQAACVVLPCGFVDGLPVGLLVATRTGGDVALLKAARQVQHATFDGSGSATPISGS